MELIDSHCHLDRLDYSKLGGGPEEAIEAAARAGVSHMLCVCIDLENFPAVRKLAEIHPQVFCSVGVHPNEEHSREPDADELAGLADHPRVVAIGETGLDYYRSSADAAWQRDRFRRHVMAARRTGKPLIVHTRQAREDTLAVLREEGATEVGGVMHCFTEDWAMAQAALDLGFYISFSGIVTFKNAEDLRDVAQRVPLDRLLIETDAPYLTPVPLRGKPNQPAYGRYVAELLAQLRNTSAETIAEATTRNFFTLFRHATRLPGSPTIMPTDQ